MVMTAAVVTVTGVLFSSMYPAKEQEAALEMASHCTPGSIFLLK